MATETSTGIFTTQPVLGVSETISNEIEMTHYSQTHNVDAAGPIRLLTPRTTTKLGTWNVRTMFEAGRAQQIKHSSGTLKVKEIVVGRKTIGEELPNKNCGK